MHNIPVVVADHTPWHSFTDLLTSPLGWFVIIGLAGIVGFSLLRRKK